MIPILLLVTATFRPPAPTVGDPITVDFTAPVMLDKSPHYEIVSQSGSRAVIRTFEPRPFAISGRVGDVAFRNMIVPVRSVLQPADSLAPAPLKPPRLEPFPRLPFVAIGIAALLAAAAWTLVSVLARRAVRIVTPAIPPAERFRAAVIALRDDPGAHRRWSRLADATREYLDLGLELTTREVLARLSDPPLISEILRQGDLEKFSPWGARPGDFASLANRALELAAEPEPEEEAAA